MGLLALEAVFFSEEREELGLTQIRIRGWMALERPNNCDQDKGRALRELIIENPIQSKQC